MSWKFIIDDLPSSFHTTKQWTYEVWIVKPIISSLVINRTWLMHHHVTTWSSSTHGSKNLQSLSRLGLSTQLFKPQSGSHLLDSNGEMGQNYFLSYFIVVRRRWRLLGSFCTEIKWSNPHFAVNLYIQKIGLMFLDLSEIQSDHLLLLKSSFRIVKTHVPQF